MQQPEVEQHPAFNKWRMIFFYGLIAVVSIYYVARLFSLQIVSGKDYQTRAEDNRTMDISLPTERGLIYDRNGFILAQNVASYNLVITPANLPTDPGAVQEIYRQLSELIGMPVNNGNINEETVRNFTPCQTDLGITQIVYIGDSLAPFNAVKVKCNIDQTAAKIIAEKSKDLPGVGIEIETVRDYPTGDKTAEVVGFLGPIPAVEQDYWESLGFISNRDKVGYAGVENSLNDILIGKNGERIVEVDNAGKILRDLVPPVDAVPGNSVELTIDTRLQNAAQAALVREMESWNLRLGQEKYSNGVVIAMDPRTGEILALVSYPSYENNRMSRFIPAYYYDQLQKDPKKPLFNQAISAEHPPGSVFKMPTAIGILNEGVVTPEQKINDPGVIRIEEKYLENDPNPRSREYVCYLYKSTGGGHGDLDYLGGVSQSCDVYFYKVGGGYKDEVPEGLGILRIGEYARALGYGQKLGIELPGEQDGLIPDPNWKRVTVGENWSTGDTYIATIGQGYVLATPLQVLVSVATLANDGKLMRPTIVHQILDSNGNIIQPFQADMLWDITKDPKIHVYDENFYQTGETKIVEPWAVEMSQKAMREVVTTGTAATTFEGFDIPSAGKTGTAEYCDDIAREKNICVPGSWPAHAWYVGYAPYDDPEIAVLAFVYNGDEGSRVAAPIVRQVMDAYFNLKEIDRGIPETATP